MGVGAFFALLSISLTFFIGYVGATAYLAFRDDLVSSSIIRQARMKHEYEDRIAALRAKVDRITSRQLLDQQAVEAKVSQLMKQQEMLTGRSGMLDGLMERAKTLGIDHAVLDEADNHENAAEQHGALELDAIQTGSTGAREFNQASISINSVLRGSTMDAKPGAPIALLQDVASYTNPSASLFTDVLGQVETISRKQRDALLNLQLATAKKAETIASVAKEHGLPIETGSQGAAGGPFIPNEALPFDEMTDNLASAFEMLEAIRDDVRALPVGNPVPGAPLSSRFGSRKDPFHGRSAFHSGLDFRAVTGTPVMASGSGRIVHAGRKGGYGLLVEIDHGNGIRTRYAHLSRILVKLGQTVKSGNTIGRVGSTGRSTGPHLHYEVRHDKKPKNPARFLKAGEALKKHL